MSLSHKLCPHCGKELNIKTYKEHKRLYYNDSTKEWLRTEPTLFESDSEASTDMSLPGDNDSPAKMLSDCDEELRATGSLFSGSDLYENDSEMEYTASENVQTPG